MFGIETLIAECQQAAADANPRGAIREVLTRTVVDPGPVAAVLAKNEAAIDVIFNSPDLTILNVIWAPGMNLMPHDHRMWASIGVYGGSEENTLYRRGPKRIAPAGGRTVEQGEVFSLGIDAIHSVHNPRRRFTGAIHVYGGDFLNQPRSQWDPDKLVEQKWSMDAIRAQFAAANAAWRAQLGQDIDETAK